MKHIKIPAIGLILAFSATNCLAQKKVRTPEEEASREAARLADDSRRHEIPAGGDFHPDPKVPALVAITHGMRLVLSLDDGKTWKQIFFGRPAGDHGYWASSNVAYTNGVFAGFAGWGSAGHGSFVASEDGVNWRHLAGPDREGRWDSYGMNDVHGAAAGGGVFVASGTQFQSTPDFGKTWHNFSPGQLKPPVKTHHIRVVFGDHEGGRFLALGDGPKVFYSTDLGKTWVTSRMEGWGTTESEGLHRGLAYGNGTFVIVLGNEKPMARCSTDGGETWTVHPTGAEGISGRFSCLSFVNGEFWLAGKVSRSSKDGKTWRDLPDSTPPSGKFVMTDKGTYINVQKKSGSILRSMDGITWTEVFSLPAKEMETGGGPQGFGDVEFGYLNELPVR